MSTATELLRRACELMPFVATTGFQDTENHVKALELYRDTLVFLITPSDDAEEPFGYVWKQERCDPDNPLGARDFEVETCFDETPPNDGTPYFPVFLHPPRPKPEAEPVYQVATTWNANSPWIDVDEVQFNTAHQAKRIVYLHPPRPEPARKPLPEKIDPILRTAGSMKYHPSYVAGWNNCIDAMSNGSEARKLMTDAESYDEYKKFMDRVDGDVDPWTSFGAGIFAAEKHHLIGESDD